MRYRKAELFNSLGVDIEMNVAMTNHGKHNQELISDFLQAEEDLTLYVLLHDEAHYGIGTDSIMSKLFTSLVFKPNRIVVHITATSMSYIGGGIPECNTQYWENVPKTYIGIEDVKLSSKYEVHSVLALTQSNPDEDLFEGPDLDIPIEYCKALVYYSCGDNYASPFHKYLRDLKKSKHPIGIVVRVKNTKAAVGFCQALREIRNSIYGEKSSKIFEVIVDVSSRNFESLNIPEHQGHKEIYSSWINEKIELFSEMTKQGDVREEDIFSYEVFLNIPTVLILVNKAKEGATFPKSIKYYDIRVTDQVGSADSYIQSLGRAFGYKRDTTVYISEKGREYIDTESGAKCTNVNTKKDGTPEDCSHFAGENRKRDVGFKNRFLLSAHPQIGKTGCILYLCYLLYNKVTNAREEEDTREANILIFKEKDLDIINEYTSSDDHLLCIKFALNMGEHIQLVIFMMEQRGYTHIKKKTYCSKSHCYLYFAFFK